MTLPAVACLLTFSAPQNHSGRLDLTRSVCIRWQDPCLIPLCTCSVCYGLHGQTSVGFAHQVGWCLLLALSGASDERARRVTLASPLLSNNRSSWYMLLSGVPVASVLNAPGSK